MTFFFPHRSIAGDWHVCTRDADGAIVSLQSDMTHKDALDESIREAIRHYTSEPYKLSTGVQVLEHA